MNEALDLSLFVRHAEDGSDHMDLAVEGVGCAGCIRKIETGLRQTPGIIDARLNFTNRRLAVGWRQGELQASDILETLARIGYRAHPFKPERAENEEAAESRRLIRCLAVAGFAAMNVMLLSVSVWSGNASDMTQETRDFFHWVSALIALPAAAYAGQPFFQSALRALRYGEGVARESPEGRLHASTRAATAIRPTATTPLTNRFTGESIDAASPVARSIASVPSPLWWKALRACSRRSSLKVRRSATILGVLRAMHRLVDSTRKPRIARNQPAE